MNFWRTLKRLSLAGFIVLVAVIALLALMHADGSPKFEPGRSAHTFVLD